jgi:hypothetical protein
VSHARGRNRAVRKTTPAFATTASGEPVLGLAEGSKERTIRMRSEEAHVGKRVRVRDDHRKVGLRGREGTIVERWGNPSYAALDVMLDEGDWQLFWYHELEEIEEES